MPQYCQVHVLIAILQLFLLFQTCPCFLRQSFLIMVFAFPRRIWMITELCLEIMGLELSSLRRDAYFT